MVERNRTFTGIAVSYGSLLLCLGTLCWLADRIPIIIGLPVLSVAVVVTFGCTIASLMAINRPLIGKPLMSVSTWCRLSLDMSLLCMLVPVGAIVVSVLPASGLCYVLACPKRECSLIILLAVPTGMAFVPPFLFFCWPLFSCRAQRTKDGFSTALPLRVVVGCAVVFSLVALMAPQLNIKSQIAVMGLHVVAVVIYYAVSKVFPRFTLGDPFEM